ncbi:ATP-dependent DNA helicase [Microlunatus soli]|uniref:DNA 3'-5' helicase n=1 Tax=Microlunatus soli TaxID=630515 RepID=A0A1H1MQ18_9ACTN|nr:ATP-dependent DNA helicase [Microlunatus soli]SDR88836.1 DNA helicase-2 / ATP-dependent DNA helicase PcrA [Microlunatus soli]
MTEQSTKPSSTGARRLTSTDDLIDALGIQFSLQQLTAITAPLEPGVIIAGAGSGKTTVMAARVVWLVGTGAVRPEEVLGLTFTRKAAAELSARVRSALLKAEVIDEQGVDEAGEQLIMTYDAFAARLVAEQGLRLGVESESSMISGAARFRLASRVVEAAAGPFEQLSRLRPQTVTERVLGLDADLQQHLVPTAALDPHARRWRLAFQAAPVNNRGNVYADVKRALAAIDERLELASLVEDYQALKQRLEVVEFADQMAVAARLATEVPEVSSALREEFKVVLLDEYQDTSAAQAIMLAGLFSGPEEKSGRGHPVTAVGDPFQAIYGWRGAAASNILEFASSFPRVDGRDSRRFALTVNRRSGQTILDVANTLSESLRADDSLQPADGTAEGLGLLHAPPEAGPGEVRAATFQTWGEEVNWIADQVVAARQSQTVDRWSEIAILTRRNADIGPLYAELVGRDVPTEIVGLGGLLSLPEVSDVVSTLRLIDDVTANPDLIRLLGGPRWNISPRDLAQLGRRARELAQQDPLPFGDPDEQPDDDVDADGGVGGLLGALEQAVGDLDPTEVISLLDAVEDPGEEFGEETRRRFAQLAAELGYLRRHADEPLLDLCRRVIAVLGLDVELLATPDFGRTQRRDQLGAFTDAVADYADVDGQASLSGLLSYLRAESEYGTGLEQAVPTDRESVKLLTMHKAKGLEWDVVFLPALMKGTFPSDRVSDNWVISAGVLPADLRGDAGSIPQLSEAAGPAIADYKQRLKDQQLRAEDRLAYVAATRSRRVLIGTGHNWRPELVKARQPSSYLQTIIAEAGRQDRFAPQAPPAGDVNPHDAQAPAVPWPRPLDPEALDRRRHAAELVRAAQQRRAADGSYEPPAGSEEPLLLDDEETVAVWDADIRRLLEESLASRRGAGLVALPESLTATELMKLRADGEAFATDLARPMPRRPSRRQRFGTRFHQWIERRLAGAAAQLVDPDELTDRADLGIGDEAEFRELCERFADGQFGNSQPMALEAPFTLVLGGRVIRGRIDAVYRTGTGSYQIVDWKTARGESHDPLQLAIYRVAWAELSDVDPEQVDAIFYSVPDDTIIRPSRLADRAELERILADVPQL